MIRNRRQKKKKKVLAVDCPAGASAEPGPPPAVGGFDPVQAFGLVAVIAGLAAAWIAAGSTGLLAHPLRRALTLAALGVAILAQRPFPWRQRTGIIAMLATVGLAIYMIASSLPVVNVMGVSLVLASLAFKSHGQAKKMLRISSVAVVVFGLYRVACTSIPMVWSMSDLLGRTIGNIGGLVTHQPLYVGATFAGLDFLVLMSVLWVLWLACSPQPRWKRAIYGLVGILGGHIVYLIVLSYTPQLLAMVAEPTEQEGWFWAGLFHKAVPWNLPVLACGIHLLTAAAMFRWSVWSADSERNLTKASVLSSRTQYMLRFGAPVLAILLPIMIAFYPGKLNLEGKKIVFYEKGFLNWLKPSHGQYGRLSSGMYGMLPVFIESLGANSLISPDLSEEDLQDADALVLLFPDDPWAEGQLDRIWAFVRRGGSLLVMAEHTTRDENGNNRFNEVLEPTAIRVEFDSGTFAVGGWLQSYEVMAHPATAGVPDDRNQFGVVIGASLETSWPARPLLIGRWGWSDMGDEGSGRAMMGNGHYDSGEKLGDLVLAAEQPMGKGRIIAFGDTSGLTNGINVSSHVFTSRLFGYLAGNAGNAHPIWRQLLGISSCGLLIGLLTWRTSKWRVVLVTLGLAGSLTVSTAISQSAGEILPDGRYKSPNNLAYIDTSHLAAYSGESWRPDGIGGFILTLMRNGYLTHSLPELTAKRLVRADLLVSIAPSRSFSKREQTAIKDFVTNGGTFIIMVGLDRADPSRSLLSLFGFTIGTSGPYPPEPEVMGHFKAPYLSSGDQRVHVRFHAAWPIACNDPEARVIAYGRNDSPVIILRPLGAGKVVVIGDTHFATNKNLEWEGGQPFEGMRENADFWRWFITQLRDQEMWIPPALQSQPESEQNGTALDNSNQEVTN
ncbi:MAG: hypothetical protein IIC00_11605 [Planctomycetes bacterium]|nr:hypothetical protein [Planctomycetota bacterium]